MKPINPNVIHFIRQYKNIEHVYNKLAKDTLPKLRQWRNFKCWDNLSRQHRITINCGLMAPTQQTLVQLQRQIDKVAILEQVGISTVNLAGMLHFKFITSLILFQTTVTTLPNNIDSLTLLQRITITSNIGEGHLVELPDSINNLMHLKWLVVDNNRLTHLPKMGMLSNLYEFSAINNQLQGTVEELEELTRLNSLSVLNLEGNPLALTPFEDLFFKKSLHILHQKEKTKAELSQDMLKLLPWDNLPPLDLECALNKGLRRAKKAYYRKQ